MKALIFVLGQAFAFNIILPLWYIIIKCQEVFYYDRIFNLSV